MSRNLRKRKSYTNTLEQDDEKTCKIIPVAASSPYGNADLDEEDREFINEAKTNLEGIKREVSRQARLTKIKLGIECTKVPFNKALFANNVSLNHQMGLANKSSNTNSGLSTFSFTNAASSTGTNSKDKNASYELKRKNMNNSKHLKLKEVTFSDTFDKSNSKYFLRRNSNERFGESSNQFSFRVPSTKKQGGRAVALVTPGPDVDRPMSVLRRPTAGEMAISMFGSPLLVAPDLASTTTPQINLPTADGKVVAILPREGFTIDDMPHIATPTRHQLKTLNRYLNDLCHQHDRF